MIIGTAGHIDHGKTALVRALTGVDTDRLAEEKARGITIDLGFAYQPLPGGKTLGFVDVPGHERFVHNMLAGATGIDYVLLVIAADDGPMPQTREHLQILDLLGLARGAVALTKLDLVTAGRAEALDAQIRSLLAGTSLDGSPVFKVSSVTGAGIAALRAHLQAAAAATLPRRAGGHFRLAVDRCFTLAGSGTVVTGTVFSGAVRAGDQVVVSPAGLAARVRGLHAENRPAESGMAGQRCALNLTGAAIEKSAVHRGDWVLAEAVHAPSERLDVQLRLLPTETRPLRHWTPVHVHLATADVTGRAALLEDDALTPGAATLAQLVLDKPIAALHGDRFILRDQSARRTLGGGRVLDPFPPARGRRTPERRALLRALGEPTPEQALAHLLATGTGGIDLGRFDLTWNLNPAEARALRASLPLVAVNLPGETLAFSPQHWESLKKRVLEALADYHRQSPDTPGPDPERLRRAAESKLAKPAFAVLVEELAGQGRLVRDGPWLRLPEHQARLSPADQRLWDRIAPLLEQAGFQPPRVRDIARALALDESTVRQLLRRAARMGEVLLVAHDHYYPRATVARLAAIAQQLAASSAAGQAGGAAGGEVETAGFRDRVDTGRKLAIHILEFFDRSGFTWRVGERRRVRQDYRAVFGSAEPDSRSALRARA